MDVCIALCYLLFYYLIYIIFITLLTVQCRYRYIALRGYSSDNLLPGDRWRLTSNSGQRFPHPSLVDAPPPLPYRWRAAQAEEAVGGWSIDRSHRDTDDAGWAYCRSFEPSVTLDGGSAAPSPRQGDMVRFRRWVRCALLDL